MTADIEDIQARIHYSGYQAFDRAARQIRLPPSAASAPVPENAKQRWHAGGYLRRLQEIAVGLSHVVGRTIEQEEHFGLLLSQYAGVISQRCKRYLRPAACSCSTTATAMRAWPRSTTTMR